MTKRRAFEPRDWDAVRLVVFDVDGTLYEAGRLRRRMAFEMSRDAVWSLDVGRVRVVLEYRRVRERAGVSLAPLAEEEAIV